MKSTDDPSNHGQRITLKSDKKELTCSICRRHTYEVCIRSCSHIFCYSCSSQLMVGNDYCPVCDKIAKSNKNKMRQSWNKLVSKLSCRDASHQCDPCVLSDRSSAVFKPQTSKNAQPEPSSSAASATKNVKAVPASYSCRRGLVPNQSGTLCQFKKANNEPTSSANLKWFKPITTRKNAQPKPTSIAAGTTKNAKAVPSSYSCRRGLVPNQSGTLCEAQKYNNNRTAANSTDEENISYYDAEDGDYDM